MNESEALTLRAALHRLRDALLAEGAVEVKVESSDPVASAADEDEAPFREMDQAIASARNRERGQRMDQIEDALRRLQEDPESYGLCDSCDQPIAPRRLALMPFAKLCVDCQGSRETKGHFVRKKVMDYQ